MSEQEKISCAEIYATRDEINSNGGFARTRSSVDDSAFMSLASSALPRMMAGTASDVETLAAALAIAFEIGLRIGRKRTTTELTRIPK